MTKRAPTPSWWNPGYTSMQPMDNDSAFTGGLAAANAQMFSGDGFSSMPSISMDTPAIAPQGMSGGWSDWLFGGKTKDGTTNNGAAGTILGVAQGLGNAYMGMKQYGLATDIFNENKRQFALNFGTQAKLTNARLADRQAARVASNPGAYQSVGDYMNINRVG